MAGLAISWLRFEFYLLNDFQMLVILIYSVSYTHLTLPTIYSV